MILVEAGASLDRRDYQVSMCDCVKVKLTCCVVTGGECVWRVCGCVSVEWSLS